MSLGKEYLGDGLFAAFDGYQIVLTAEDGERTTNTVYLDPRTLHAFNDYQKRLKASFSKRRPHLKLGAPTIVDCQPKPDETEDDK